jgi:hypothetical protein
MSIGAYKKMPSVIWVEIHHDISMETAVNNQSLCVVEIWHSTERTRNFIPR